MKRRDFLKASAGITGTVLPVFAWGQAAPCPPSPFGVSGGTSVTSNCGATGSGSLPVLKLTSGAAAGVRGWTVGHAFRKGDVPNLVTGVGEPIQCDVRNRWNDGSVKFAILSGVSSFSSTHSIQLAAGVPASGAAITESRILTILGAGDFVIGLGSFGSVSLKSLVGLPQTISANTPGIVRTAVSGSIMSEFHYMGIPSGGDAHLRVRLYVRVYSNDTIEVETVVENGWFQVAGSVDKNYMATVTVSGVQTYGGSITHRHHTKWSRIDWIGVNPDITPLHNCAYLRSSRMLPNYGWGNPSEATLNALFTATNPAPTTELGNYVSGYSSGGDKDQIGLLPHWAALWAAATTTADVRAAKSVLANARVAMRYAWSYRDETTGRPPKMATNSTYANLGLAVQTSSGSGVSNVGNSIAPTIPGSGAFPADQIADRPHAVQDFYAAYLLSGRYSFMEAEQLKVLGYMVAAGSTSRSYNQCWFGGTEIRGRGWTLRDLALALTMTPDSDPFRSELQTIWANNMARMVADFATPGQPYYETSGWLGHAQSNAWNDSSYGDFGSTKGGAYWWDAPWMHWFNVVSFAFARDVEVPGTAQSTTDLETVLAHYAKITAGVTADGSAGSFNYRRCNQYAIPVGANGLGLPCESKFTWPQIYALIQTELSIPALPDGSTLLSNTNSELTAGDFDASGSNFGHLVAALAAVSSYDVASRAGYDRLTASSTWFKNVSAWNDVPKCGIVPRA